MENTKAFIDLISPLAMEDMRTSGILASITIAQAILESGWGTSELAVNANNFFGMKKSLSGNTWPNSTWDGKSIYTKVTGEQKPTGEYYEITADFRKYPEILDSIRDHNAYLSGAMNGAHLRYAGLVGEKNYRKAIQIIKDGGYATSLTYVDKVCNLIEKYNLSKYDIIKEESGMKIVESIMTKNPCYSEGRKLDNGVQGLMLHSVGCSQPKASAFINHWNSPSYDRACVHGFIDANDGTIYQTLPWDWRGWHAGGSANNTHIGVEMCEPDCIKYTGGATFTCSDTTKAKEMVKRTYEAAVELFAMLCKQFSLDPLKDGVIISHAEGHKRGVASNHGDPEHVWSQLKVGYTMDTFRKAVAAKLSGGEVSPAPTGTPDKEDVKMPKCPFLVKVIIDDLNFRSLPSMQGNINGQTGKGIFTITEVKDGWGHLKSGAGWIYLENPNYCTIMDTVATKKEEDTKQCPYPVRVSIDNLRIRTGPGVTYTWTGRYTGKGVFTIVEVAGNWGRLKSGAGWISLAYCTEV